VFFTKHHIPESFADTTLADRVPADELVELERLSTPVRFVPGDLLTKENTIGREVVFMLDGSATVTRRGRVIAEVGPGSVIGEMALLTGDTRKATVTASSDIRAIVLNRREFATLLDQCDVLAREVLNTAITRKAAA